MGTHANSISCQTDMNQFDFELLQEYRRVEKYCDLCIQSTVEDSKKIIPCHKVILATVSPFFRHELEKGRNGRSRNIYIEEIDQETLEVLVDYMYGERINLTRENATKVFTGAQLFMLKDLEENCTNYIESLVSITEVISVFQFALSRSFERLTETSLKFILENLQEIKGHGFLELDPESVKRIAMHQMLLGAPSTEDILKAVIEWLHGNEVERAQYAFFLIKDIPLTKIPLKILRKCLREDPFMHSIPVVYSLYVDAVEEIGMKSEEVQGEKRKSEVLECKAESGDEGKDFPLPEREATSPKRERLDDLSLSQPQVILPSGNESSIDELQPQPETVPATSPVAHEDQKAVKPLIYFVARDQMDTRFKNSIVSFDLETSEVEILGMHRGFQKSTSLVYHDRMIYSLGDSKIRDGNKYNFVSVFNVEKLIWEKNAPNHVQFRPGFKPFVHDGYLYTIGGSESSKASSRVERLNLRDRWFSKWMEVENMPFSCCSFGICVADNCIYVLGGSTWNSERRVPSTIDSVASYDPLKNQWAVKASMPTPRRGLAAVVLGPYIYAMGGSTKKSGSGIQQRLCSVDVYDIKSDKWCSGVPMSKERQYFSAVAHNNCIYAIGGDSEESPTMEKFDTDRQQWTDMGKLPINGFYHSVVFCSEET